MLVSPRFYKDFPGGTGVEDDSQLDGLGLCCQIDVSWNGLIVIEGLLEESTDDR